jgi:transcriptional regulator with XRE-family HTH domain
MNAELKTITAEIFQGLTLGQLEEATGVSRARWCKYFHGKQMMREDILNRTASYLGLPSGVLLEAIAQRRNLTIKKKEIA